MKVREHPTCPLEIAHDMIRGKWKTIIIFQLRDGKHSLAYLRNTINGISEKILIEQLNELIEFGIVNKINYEGYPRKVDYFLTDDRGKDLLEVVFRLQKIGQEYLNQQSL